MPHSQGVPRRRWLRNGGLAALLLALPAPLTWAAPLPVTPRSGGVAPSSEGQRAGGGASVQAAPFSCPVASRRDPVTPPGPLLHSPRKPPSPDAAGATSAPVRAGLSSPPAAAGGDYREALSTTTFGWAHLDHWCLWIEPGSGDPAGRLWEQRWQAALGRAIGHWQQLLPIRLVDDPAAAQVLVWRRRPPRSVEPDGHRRASHGRATLSLVHVTRQGVTRLEPSVEVQLSPAQRESAIEATALHELGHAFGLWGHSDQAADAMASVPGAAPVLQLTPRDRATLDWLLGQPTRIGETITP